MTPEGITKRDVKKIIAGYGEDIESHWPVIGRLGAPTIDCNMVCWGWAVSIECKSPGEKPTKRQWGTINKKRAAGGICLVVDGLEDSYQDLRDVLGQLHQAWMCALSPMPYYKEAAVFLADARRRADLNLQKFLESAPKR